MVYDIKLVERFDDDGEPKTSAVIEKACKALAQAGYEKYEDNRLRVQFRKPPQKKKKGRK